MKSNATKLVEKHANMNHLDDAKVVSHVQRDDKEWVRHTVMLEGYDVPFRFLRKDQYKSLKGARVNVTYYPQTDTVAGLPFEYMKVVRIKRS